MRFLLSSIASLLLVSRAFGQFLGTNQFRIYERQDAVYTALRLNRDSTYTILPTRLLGSLQDRDTLARDVYQAGKWYRLGDTLFLMDENRHQTNKMLVQGLETLKPLFYTHHSFSTAPLKDPKATYELMVLKGNSYHLTYETYPTGVVKRTIQRDSEGNWEGLTIEYDLGGNPVNVDRFKKESSKRA